MFKEPPIVIKGILFDLNGTLIDIYTTESDDQLYRVTTNYLDYYGVKIAPCELKRRFFELNRMQRQQSEEDFPEFDVAKIFQQIIGDYHTRPLENTAELARSTAVVFRAAGRYKLECYDGVYEIMRDLKKRFLLGAVSDGQSLWAVPELQSVNLEDFFQTVVVSGDLGYRKPDIRLFKQALDALQLAPQEVIFVGNDMYRDVYGAHAVGMKTVFFKSNQGDHSYHGADADYIIYNFNELPRAIEFLQ
ncbi:MAG: HAD family hydrolase [Lentisphaerae bacterium]|nr:HAD family hydrolase [Lentisphaerota bacterium]